MKQRLDSFIRNAHRLSLFLGFLLTLVGVEISAQSILPVAGGGSAEGRPATFVGIDPHDIATDDVGNVWFVDTDSHRVRRVDAATGILSTVAGNGVRGSAGDGGPATLAELDSPFGIARDESGNLFIADTFSNKVRRVDSETGIITTVAGRGGFGFSGDGGPATEAELNRPEGIAVDGKGNLYIGERNNRRVRRVDSVTGVITTVAGSGAGGFGGDGGPATEASLSSPISVAVDGMGNLLIADPDNHRVRRVDAVTQIMTTVAGTGEKGFGGDGGQAMQATLSNPLGVALDSADNLYIADSGNIRIRRVDSATGIISTIAGNGEWGFSGDGGPAIEARFKLPEYVAAAANGDIYAADQLENRIRRIVGASRLIATVAGNSQRVFTGDGGPATQASIASPGMIAFDSEGNLYVADTGQQRVRKITSDTGVISTIAGGVWGHAGDGGLASEAELEWPGAVALDSGGNLFIADRSSDRIRRVDRETGIISAFAGTGTAGFSGDDGPATQAELDYPDGLAVDSAGNVFIADVRNHRIRRVASGTITTVAGNGTQGFSGDGGLATLAMLSFPGGVTVDEDGNLFIADEGNHRVRYVDGVTGIITTVAGSETSGSGGDGGPATEASLTSPKTIALDVGQNLYIADTWNHRVRRIDSKTGTISTVAGTGDLGFRGDFGPASEAWLGLPEGIALDSAGNLYIADQNVNRVRVVFECVDVEEPELVTPADGSQGLPRAPSLGWTSVVGAFRYDVYLDVVSPPQRLVAMDIETSAFSLTNLAPLTNYYWKVVAKGDPFCTPSRIAESEVRSFATTRDCEAPVIPSSSGAR